MLFPFSDLDSAALFLRLSSIKFRDVWFVHHRWKYLVSRIGVRIRNVLVQFKSDARIGRGDDVPVLPLYGLFQNI